ncbi:MULTISPECIES: FtsX-like permease family protein [Liquorilactobacillus]|uniref:FtsX-like permease family protein n=1 Tax=Liquorilactobacillus TaxID=2767888 RepID=UPI0021C339AB|nr:FtsX-like permease family protein [Liquorilactobacillus satsumensis]MCP9328678.1 FtsX-like permease family protein [Liquorilactobacillus satsumensis]
MKILNKNIIREFKISRARFISVSSLLMLGVFVFIGLNVTGPNMRKTAQEAYTTENLADAKVNSTIPLDTKDRATIRHLSGIKTVEFGHTTDVLIEGTNHAIQVQSNPQTLSKLTLTKGHQANTSSQIVLSNKLHEKYKLGEKITFVIGKNNTSTGLTHKTFTIVGFATSTEYLKKDKVGSTSLGSGTLYGFAYATKTTFSSSKPNIARLAFKHTKGKAYSTTYEHHATAVVDKLQKTLNKRNRARVASLRHGLNTKITTGQTKLKDGKASLKAATAELNTAQTQLDTQLAQAKTSNSSAAITQLTAKQQELNQQKKSLEKQQSVLQTVKKQIAKAKVTKRQLKDISLTIGNRNDYNDGYNNYGEDAARIDALGKSFPAFFFLIAILVSFTTMRRMVEEKRIEMGTLRALGYTKSEVMREFIIYSISTAITGTLLGSLLGLVALPQIIFRAYTANFNFSTLLLALHPWYIITAFGLAVFSTVLSSWLAANSSLKIITAELMLPKPPTSGSRILLERIPLIWNNLSFSHKVTVRNLFRYKGRMFMTIIGVAGATALMITGFGIRDSLNTIISRQFGQISRYDLVTVYNPNAADSAISKAKNAVTANNNVKHYTAAFFSNVYATTNNSDSREDISLMVPFATSKLESFVKLRDYKTDKKLTLSDNGAIISQKLAKLQGITVGDYLTIKDTNGTAHKIKISGITTMYAGHYVYMNREYYHKIYNEDVSANAYLVTLKHASNKSVNTFSTQFNRHEAAVQTVQSRETQKTITNILNNLNNLILVLVLSASLLSLVVLYTLTNINVSERVRELSTLKVLGFYPKEVLLYIYRETNILTGIGIFVGIGVGYAFHAYIMALLPPATAMVAPGLTWINILISVGLTIIFSLTVMFMMNRKIQNVDMLEALKSVD